MYYLIQASQRKIRQGRQLLQSIVDSTTDAIFVKDRQGRFLLVNGPSAKILGHPAQAILGKYNHELLPAAVAHRIDRADLAHWGMGVAASLPTVSTLARTVAKGSPPDR